MLHDNDVMMTAWCVCVCLFSVCQPQMVIDCCLSVKNKTITKHIITDYHQQSAGQGCSIEATM